MYFVIGSTNPSKICALTEVLVEYDEFKHASLSSVKTASGVSEQPMSLEEICLGARNRAYEAFHSRAGAADYGVGLESGLILVPGTKTGMMATSACMIYDGVVFAPGLSSAFECPAKVIRLVKEGGLDLNRAFHDAGLSNNLKLGNEGGAIGELSKGHVSRSQYMMQAIRMALIHLQNPELY